MGFPSRFVEDLEPRIHSIIKNQLGFSEPSLLNAAIHVITNGASREALTRKKI
jgi:hypothetical protein